MNNEEKLFELMTRMYGDMQEGFKDIRERLDKAEKSIVTIGVDQAVHPAGGYTSSWARTYSSCYSFSQSVFPGNKTTGRKMPYAAGMPWHCLIRIWHLTLRFRKRECSHLPTKSLREKTGLKTEKQ